MNFETELTVVSNVSILVIKRIQEYSTYTDKELVEHHFEIEFMTSDTSITYKVGTPLYQ